MTDDNIFQVKKFRVEDLQQTLLALSNASTAPEKTRQLLKNLLIFSAENEDSVSQMLCNGAVKVLSELFSVSKLKDIKAKIGSILVLLCFADEKSNVTELSEIVTSTLANIFTGSDLNVFLESISGIRVIITSASSSSPPEVRSLPISVCAILFEHATAALAPPASSSFSSSSFVSVPVLKDRDKQELLEALVALVEDGAMNEAARIAVWYTSGGEEGGGGGGGERGGSGGGEYSNSTRFLKSFEAFSKVVKTLWEGKRKTGLSQLAKSISGDIESQQFFPVRFPADTNEKEKKKTDIALPLKFVTTNYNGGISVAGGKHTWNQSAWHTIVLDEEMMSGIYKAVVECSGNFSGGVMRFGLMSKTRVLSCSNEDSGTRAGECMIYYGGMYTSSTSVFSQSLFAGNGKVTLSLELNADSHTVYFFVDGKQIPHCVTNVPPSVYVLISDIYTGNVVDVKSLQKLTAPSISPSLQCSQYPWK